MSQRHSLLRYTRSVHKLCAENGKDDEANDHKSIGSKAVSSFPLTTPTTTSSSSSSSSSSSGYSTAPVRSAKSPSRSATSPGRSATSPIRATTSPVRPSILPTSPQNNNNAPDKPQPASADSAGRKSAGRRLLQRESASRHLPTRQIEQAGAPPTGTQRSTIGRKDTISVWDWFRAMDEEAERDKAFQATLRGKSMRPSKSSRRVNTNFEDFMRQAQEAEEKAALPKSKSMPAVENRATAAKPTSILAPQPAALDGASQMPPEHKEDSIADKQIAEDDESLKVFMQAWNQLDTFEEHLAVQVELAQAAEEKLQISKEEAKQSEASSDLLDAPFSDATTTLKPEVPLLPSPTSTSTATPTPTETLTVTPTPTPTAAPTAAPTETPTATPTPEPTPQPEPTKTTVSPRKEDAKSPRTDVKKSPRGGDTIRHSPRTGDKQSPRSDGAHQSPRKDVPHEVALDDSTIPSNYKGPHYKPPITNDFVEALLQYCAGEGLSAKFPRSYAQQIVLDAMELFRAEPTILDVPLNSKAVVIGDIHGQFPDLITILRDTGLPSANQTLIFNGDFVDRGPAGVEVLLCLYAMKIVAPQYIFIHRGNHELESINRKYNFADQVIAKYDEELFILIQDSFALLPLGCVIANRVLVIHGGLPEEPVSLGQIRMLPKLREDPTKATGGQEKLVQGILWSDPKERRGTRASKRGAGVEFGPDVTATFMARSNLDLIVRSHEMVEEGYSLTHDGSIMTIFSASYYCGVSTNKGAFAVFTAGSDLKTPTIVQYYAQAYSARDSVLKSCVKETLEKLREMIFVNRHRLLVEFSNRDPKCTGKVSKADWAETMANVMGLHIGWHGMLPYLAKVETDEKVIFIKFLDRYKITAKDEDDDLDDEDEDAEDKRDKKEEKMKEWIKETIGYMCANMHAFLATTLSTAFAKLDKDNDGKLSYTEFNDALSTLKLNLTVSEDNQFYDTMRKLDIDEDGMISQKDFEESLKIPFERVQTLHKEEWIPEAVKKINAAIDKNFDFIVNPKSRMKSAFRKCRAEGGKVQRRGFSDWIDRTLELEEFTSVQRLRLALYVDFNGNGKISWKEFKKVFRHLDYYSKIQENLFKLPSPS